MSYDPAVAAHQEWIGYVKPIGVVVSIPALIEAGIAADRASIPLHRDFLAVLPETSLGQPEPRLEDFQRFAVEVLKWRSSDLAGPDETLTIPVPGYDELLHPDYVVKDGDTPLLLIVKTKDPFDETLHDSSHPWPASPQARFERLLRETGVAIGLLVSAEAIRLVYAPKGESSGYITFRVADMIQVAGRPILSALYMLLSPERLFTASEGQRLPALLKASRRYQNTVSTKLSGQVTEALFELLRGFQSAHDQLGILDEVLDRDPNEVYAGLLTVLLRIVFVLYAEDRDLLSPGELWVNNYSVGGLHERLTADRAQFPDTMDQRYGAWAQLLVLFRIIFEGAHSGSVKIPARRGYLFDPERYPFLEGRRSGQPSRQTDSPLVLPRISDGSVQKVLALLLVLDGERLSYRNLDVEQIGSVYETMMGFELHLAAGQSIALKPKKKHGAPITISLERLLAEPAAKRNEWLNNAADQKLSGKPEQALKDAATVDELLAALDKRIARNVTPEPVRAGAMIFQPSPERRRSGSHYTPRTLTAPIVEHALKPVLDGLMAANAGQHPRPWQVLALKVCDPAMGSGAFLVEACRQLGDVLVEAWHLYGDIPIIPPDEDEVLHARRLVAQRCLYGVAQVERVAPSTIPGVTLEMESLSKLPDGAAAEAALMPLVDQYRSWIEQQKATVPVSPVERQKVGNQLMAQASVAAERIKRGILLLANRECLRAFTLANAAMAMQARQRFGSMEAIAPAEVKPPSWRPFQLAFLLMNLPGIAEPESEDREIVDLLFFPTGGGKTEAYLGLAAFTLVLRRLRNPGIQGAGLCVLMRYTLRLLTLDQLGRGATLICALELLREKNTDLGEWRFEIGLWVGRAATPNVMGSKDQDYPDTARRRAIDYGADSRKPSPIPLELCPWCGTRFERHSFRLMRNGIANQSFPTDLEIVCVNRDCPFIRERSLPILAVDDQIYRRLPCFMIATVDKFAGMPFMGATAGFFGKVQRFDENGFYGPTTPDVGARLPDGSLLPPELIIQDELHLISGPLGTMVGLYESALEKLASRTLPDGREVRPKIVASTATVRRAQSQIQALFNRPKVEIFPPPGPDRRDSFFAETLTPTDGDQKTNARLYVGIAAQGRSPKVAMLRVYRALLGAGETSYRLSKKNRENPADPYMTLLGYFNALRELGGARRLIEDEVRSQLERYGSRKRVSETHGSFLDRKIAYEPVELTSRISTARVSEAKDTLGIPFSEPGHADVAIATNMISVGLDITRLGLMVVFGQPKTSAEYIQATSRVGRDPERPGLVVTILNVHKPRDRSHYERFCAYHESFYRSVEATSVTPFSPRALDRGLAASMVALTRLGYEPMTAANGVGHIVEQRERLKEVVDYFADRAFTYKDGDAAERQREQARVQSRATDLLDEWLDVVQKDQDVLTVRRYNQYEPGTTGPSLLKDFLDPELRTKLPDSWEMKFRANRSLRDVEPNVNLWLRRLDQPRNDEEL
ncbi:DISARM system helicase DrmA [Terriglobus roseus]|uniref:site-specific DNA-methyltransferase (adenine-specific) n=1 Tax=Terriglobus roseus TaxID=392734 RepID=A0A1H4RQV9_9BACT|nr:DISARM system helicase DrmA [Terriglobus roseus]SEC34144.1 Helicase conserved C-terminal domain-containing protein [Terriglobus roseus]